MSRCGNVKKEKTIRMEDGVVCPYQTVNLLCVSISVQML